MVSFLAVGDTHYKPGNKNQTDLLEKLILREVSEQPVDFVIFLGDILHDFGKVNTRAKSRVLKFFEHLSKITKIYAIIGNHDYINNRQFMEEEHAFQCVQIDNCRFIDRPTVIDGYPFLAVPYVPPGKFREAIAEHITNKSIIFAHQEFRGAEGSTIGDLWEEDIKVISGHIHRPQTIGNVIYTGAAIQTNYGETWNTFIYRVQMDAADHHSTMELVEISTNSTGRLETYTIDVVDPRKTKLPPLQSTNKIRVVLKGSRSNLALVKARFAKKLAKYDKVVYVRNTEEKSYNVVLPTIGNVSSLCSVLREHEAWTDRHQELINKMLHHDTV